MAVLDELRGTVGRGGIVPELQGDSMVECGAACLAMVLTGLGRETSVTEAHERCSVGRDGATALDVANAARAYGLRVDPHTLDLDDLEDLPAPAILHWGFSHFVVFERRRPGRGATIVDPMGGRREVSERELSEKFTGVALAMSAGEGFAEEVTPEGEPAWRMLARRAFRAPGARRMVGQVLAVSLVLQLLGLAVPLLTKATIDKILPLQIDDVMTVLGLGIGVIMLTQFALTFLRGLVLVNLQAKLDAQLMAGFFEHLLSLPYQYFQERSTGDLLQRLGSNAQIRNVLSSQTLTAVLDGSFVLVYGLVLLAASPVFGLVAIVLGAIQVVLLWVTARRMTTLVVQELAAQGESQAVLVETISGIEALKAAGAEDRTLSHWTGVFTGQLEASMRRGRLATVLVALTSMLQRFAPLLLLWVGAQLVLNGSLGLGSMLALVSLANLFLSPLGSLVAAGLQLQQIGGHLERIAYVLRAEPEQSRKRVRQASSLEGRITFERVSFRYDDSSPWVVRDFSLDIRPGEKVAIVGRTGSGKSTLAKLVLGLYEPQEGRILIDGMDLHELDLRSVRVQIGSVMQEPTVFNGSVRRNIAYNDPTLPLEAVERAARLASLHDDIAQMPMGYETIVAEGGSALSGGQRQRLAIARALARSPRVLVLDEATSDLDSATEATVSAHLQEQGATSIVIAHRLSTVQSADLILVVDGGRVIEQGVHEELLAQGGFYARLVHDQLVDGSEQTRGAGASG